MKQEDKTEHRSARSRRRAVPVAAAICLIAGIYACSPNFRYASGPQAPPYAGDFLQEWIGGWIVRAGDRARFYEAAYAQQLEHDTALVGFEWNHDAWLPMVYPPFYYLLVSPLSLLPITIAAWIWAMFMAAALVLSIFILVWWAERRVGTAHQNIPRIANRDHLVGGAHPAWLAWLFPAAVLYMPVVESLSSSQKGTVCLLILTATFVLWDRNKPLRAGIMFGLLAFKPQLALLIAVAALWKRQWRFVGGGLVTGLMLVGMSLAVGRDVCGQYWRFALGSGNYMSHAGYDLYKSHCLAGFYEMLLGDSLEPIGVRWITALSLAVIFGGVAFALKGKLVPGSSRFAMQFSLLVIAALLTSPHLFTYDLAVLLLPMTLLAVAAARTKKLHARTPARQTALRYVPWLVLALYVLPGVSTKIAATTGVQLTVMAMAVAAGVLVAMTQNRRISVAERNALLGTVNG